MDLATAQGEMSPPTTNSANSNSPTDRSHQLLLRSGLRLSLAMLIPLALLGIYGLTRHGLTGLATAGLSVAVCLVFGWIALACTSYLRSKEWATQGLLLSILFRTMGPLFSALVLSQQFETLANAGVFGMILFSYLCMLGMETMLAVKIVEATDPVQESTTDKSEAS